MYLLSRPGERVHHGHYLREGKPRGQLVPFDQSNVPAAGRGNVLLIAAGQGNMKQVVPAFYR